MKKILIAIAVLGIAVSAYSASWVFFINPVPCDDFISKLSVATGISFSGMNPGGTVRCVSSGEVDIDIYEDLKVPLNPAIQMSSTTFTANSLNRMTAVINTFAALYVAPVKQ